MTAEPQHRLATRCRACGELFWLASPRATGDEPCPVCAQPLPTPAGRFDGIRTLVAFAMELGPARLEHLEDSLTWTQAQLDARTSPDEFVHLRRALDTLDLRQATFWRLALLTIIVEVSKEPRLERDEETVTAIARRVVQIVMNNRVSEPRRL